MDQEEEEEVDLKNLVDLPLTRVKKIMKSDTDVKLISQEAVLKNIIFSNFFFRFYWWQRLQNYY
jgi:hypothetical protein